MTSHLPTPLPMHVAFSNISYTIPAQERTWYRRTPTPRTEILRDVSGHVAPGESLAILGPSGSGKTTLLNLLAARSAQPPTSGCVTFNGAARAPRTKRHLGYVMQDDVFFNNLTVHQTLQFTADVRLSGTLSGAQRAQRVNDLLTWLRLHKCAQTRVGDQQFDKGISGGERKRLNIANELLHNPSVLMADECTSGLDSASAFSVVRLLHRVCRRGCALVVTIHQPSSQMFALFSNVLLLAEGRVVYFGKPARIAAHFDSLGFNFPSHGCNPADFALHLLTTGEAPDDAALPSSDDGMDVPDAPDADEVDEARRQCALDRIVEGWQPYAAHLAASNVATTNKTNKKEKEEDDTSKSTSSAHVVIHVREVTSTVSSEGTMDTMRINDASRVAEETTSETDVIDAAICTTQPAPPATPWARMRRALHKRSTDVFGGRGLDDMPKKYAAGWLAQTGVLTRRAFVQKRGALLDKVHIYEILIVTLLVMVFWMRIPATETTLEDRFGLFYFVSVFWSFNASIGAVWAFPSEKHVLNKDRASGMYRLSSYYVAKTGVEMLWDTILPLFFSACVYYVVGLNPDIRAYFSFLMLSVLHFMQAQGIGIVMAACFLDTRKAFVATLSYAIVSLMLCGYVIDPENVPVVVRPLVYISIVKYTYVGLVQNELSFGREFACAGDDGVPTVYSAHGASCPARADDVLRGAQLGNAWPFWGNVCMILLIVLFTRVLGYFALKYLHSSHKPKLGTWKET